MKLKEWERDILNRQRNIVFPDTVLNEARFFRNLVSGRAAVKMVQRLGVLLVTAPFFLTGCVGLAYFIGSFVAMRDPVERLVSLLSLIGILAPLVFGVVVVVRSFIPAPTPAPKRRLGYRQPRG